MSNFYQNETAEHLNRGTSKDARSTKWNILLQLYTTTIYTWNEHKMILGDLLGSASKTEDYCVICDPMMAGDRTG